MLGDIVHIYQDKMSKLLWRLGRVVKLFPVRDGIVRSAELLTLDQSNRVTRLKRSVEKALPIRSTKPGRIRTREIERSTD